MFSIEQMHSGEWVLIGPLGSIVRMGTEAEMKEEMRRANLYSGEPEQIVAGIGYRVIGELDLVLWREVEYDNVQFLAKVQPHA